MSLHDKIQWIDQVLNAIVNDIGVKHPGERAKLHNSGYEALYEGETENDIHKRKGLKKGQAILDHMSSAEAAANWFRTTQAEQHLRFRLVKDIKAACVVHRDVGKRIRNLMKEMGGPMPENIPVVDSISEAKKRMRAYRKTSGKLK